MRIRPVATTIVALLLAGTGASFAQADRFDIGLRGGIMVADGEPANDIPGFGLFGHYRLNDRWALGFAVDQAEYDFEQPAKLVGIQQDPDLAAIDVLAESTTFSVWGERTFRAADSRNSWFVSAGLGAASIDVPVAAGPRSDGGAFEIHTEVSTELVASLGAGWRRDLGQRGLLEFGLRADQHFADWKLTDSNSAAKGSVSDYLALGGYLGVGFRF